MPKITVKITHAEMLEHLVAARRHMAETLQATSSQSETGGAAAKASSREFEQLVVQLEQGLGNIHAAIETLYDTTVPEFNRLYENMARKMASCTDPDCDISNEAKTWLSEQGE